MSSVDRSWSFRRQWIMTQLPGIHDSTHGEFSGTRGHSLNHRWKPYIHIKLIWMQYLKENPLSPQHHSLIQSHWIRSKKGHLMTSWVKPWCSNIQRFFLHTEYAVQSILNSIMFSLKWLFSSRIILVTSINLNKYKGNLKADFQQSFAPIFSLIYSLTLIRMI